MVWSALGIPPGVCLGTYRRRRLSHWGPMVARCGRMWTVRWPWRAGGFFLQLASPLTTSTTSGATRWKNLIWRTSHCGRWQDGWWGSPLRYLPAVTPGALALSDSKKAKSLADSLEAQFQLVNDPLETAVIEEVNEMRTYSFASSCKPKVNSTTEVKCWQILQQLSCSGTQEETSCSSSITRCVHGLVSQHTEEWDCLVQYIFWDTRIYALSTYTIQKYTSM